MGAVEVQRLDCGQWLIEHGETRAKRLAQTPRVFQAWLAVAGFVAVDCLAAETGFGGKFGDGEKCGFTQLAEAA
jgi:hypothetical protein